MSGATLELTARGGSRILPPMSVEIVYHWRADRPKAALRELGDVRVRVAVMAMDGDTIAAGTEGTVAALTGRPVPLRRR